jgi:hypothetical protein
LATATEDDPVGIGCEVETGHMSGQVYALLPGGSLLFCVLRGAASPVPTGPVVCVIRAREDVQAFILPTVIVAEATERRRDRNRAAA